MTMLFSSFLQKIVLVVLLYKLIFLNSSFLSYLIYWCDQTDFLIFNSIPLELGKTSAFWICNTVPVKINGEHSTTSMRNDCLSLGYGKEWLKVWSEEQQPGCHALD